MFRHPKYYKELRKRNRELRASTALPSVPQSDQAISKAPATAGNQRSPGPGLKLRHGGLTPEASGFKPQASSFRTNLFKHQATSVKPQAASVKRQATSVKLFDPRSMEHGYWRSIRG